MAKVQEEDVKLCNCAGCDVLLIGESMEDVEKHDMPQSVCWLERLKHRIDGRPYCKKCFRRRFGK